MPTLETTYNTLVKFVEGYFSIADSDLTLTRLVDAKKALSKECFNLVLHVGQIRNDHTACMLKRKGEYAKAFQKHCVEMDVARAHEAAVLDCMDSITAEESVKALLDNYVEFLGQVNMIIHGIGQRISLWSE
jgi:hypothetical protein